MDEITYAASPGSARVQRISGTDSAMSRLALLAVLFAAVPLMIAQPAPLEDWPSHLARIDILCSLLRGERFWALDHHLNTFLLPNVALDVALVGLHAIGLSIATAGTAFLLATYALFVAGGVRLAAAFGASDPVKPPIMAMLFYNSALMGGFANYVFGIGLAFFVLAAWIGAHERPGRRMVIAIAGSVAVFFAHLIAAGFLIAAMGLFELHALARQRRFNPGALVRHATAAAAAAVAIILFALSPATADGPGGGAVTYTGAPSLVGIAKGKLILLFHPLLDGSGITGAAIVVAGMGLCLPLALRTGRPRLSRSVWFVAAGLAVLVIVCPNGIGAGYGLDYRLVIPLVCVVVSAATLNWRGAGVRWLVFGILLATSAARSASFIADFTRDRATYRGFEDAVTQIPADSVLLTGMGSRWDDIPWGRFWAPPTEYLATVATAAGVFVPTVFAIASQHPLVLNRDFEAWRSFAFFSSPEDARRSRERLAAVCSDWQRLGHTGRTLLLLVYPSATSEKLILRRFVLQAGPGFELIDGCNLTS